MREECSSIDEIKASVDKLHSINIFILKVIMSTRDVLIDKGVATREELDESFKKIDLGFEDFIKEGKKI